MCPNSIFSEALRSVICIPWGFGSCLLLFMRVVLKQEVIFLPFFLLAQDHSLGFTFLFRVPCSASTITDTDCYFLILQTPVIYQGKNHGYHVWGDDDPLLPDFWKGAFGATWAAGWGDTRPQPYMPSCECAGQCHWISYPERIQVLFLLPTLPVNTYRNQFCLNSPHKAKGKIACEKRSLCCLWIQLAVSGPCEAGLDASLCSYKMKRIPCPLEYKNTLRNFIIMEVFLPLNL